MNKRPVDKTSTEDSASKRSAVDDSPEVVPVLPAQTVCITHSNAVDVAKAVIITVEVYGKGQNVSSPITVCANTTCFVCDKSLVTGDRVFKVRLRNKYSHVGCGDEYSREETVKCICHRRAVSVCSVIEVLLHDGSGNFITDFVCDNMLCLGCRKGFSTPDKVAFVHGDRLVCHRSCTVMCANPECSDIVPVSNETHIPMCVRHSIRCAQCLVNCNSASSHVALSTTSSGGVGAPFFLCIACYAKTSTAEIRAIAKIRNVPCSDPGCDKLHTQFVNIRLGNNKDGRTIACSKAACLNCTRNVTRELSYLIDDGELACEECFVPCDICKKPLIRSSPAPSYSGKCVVGIQCGWANDIVCPHHATMTCGNCLGIISVDMDTGKYYRDVNKWLHHKCRAV